MTELHTSLLQHSGSGLLVASHCRQPNKLQHIMIMKFSKMVTGLYYYNCLSGAEII